MNSREFKVGDEVEMLLGKWAGQRGKIIQFGYIGFKTKRYLVDVENTDTIWFLTTGLKHATNGIDRVLNEL